MSLSCAFETLEENRQVRSLPFTVPSRAVQQRDRDPAMTMSWGQIGQPTCARQNARVRSSANAAAFAS